MMASTDHPHAAIGRRRDRRGFNDGRRGPNDRAGPRGPCGCRRQTTIVWHGPARAAPETPMTQTSNRFFDEMARLMNDAAGVAQGVRREFDTVFRDPGRAHPARPRRGPARGIRGGQGNGPAGARGKRGAEGPYRRARSQVRPAGLSGRPGAGRIRPGFLVFNPRHGYTRARPRLQHPWRHAAGANPTIRACNTRILSWRPFRN